MPTRHGKAGILSKDNRYHSPNDPPGGHDELNVEGSIIGWALRNAQRVSRLREHLNEISPENDYKDNEELIVQMLDDVIQVYEDLEPQDFDEAYKGHSTEETGLEEDFDLGKEA